MSNTYMQYHTPPREWMEGLPIGNGRLAAMIWGDEKTDRLTLNHEWLWTGRNRSRKCEEAAGHLGEVRGYIESGEWKQAAAVGNRYFSGLGGISGQKGRVDPYQPAGELFFRPDGVQVFRARSLELQTGTAETLRALSSGWMRGEFFADCVGETLLCRWTGETAFSGVLGLVREPDAGTDLTFRTEPRLLRLDGAISGGISFAVEDARLAGYSRHRGGAAGHGRSLLGCRGRAASGGKCHSADCADQPCHLGTGHRGGTERV